MKNFIKIGKGKIEISEETAQNLREQFGKEDLIDERIQNIRISEADKGEISWPVRISVLAGQEQGLPMGGFSDGCDDGSWPGDTLTIESATKLRDALDRIIKKYDC